MTKKTMTAEELAAKKAKAAEYARNRRAAKKAAALAAEDDRAEKAMIASLPSGARAAAAFDPNYRSDSDEALEAYEEAMASPSSDEPAPNYGPDDIGLEPPTGGSPTLDSLEAAEPQVGDYSPKNDPALPAIPSRCDTARFFEAKGYYPGGRGRYTYRVVARSGAEKTATLSGLFGETWRFVALDATRILGELEMIELVPTERKSKAAE